jgi:hypothetical protein
MNKAMRNAYEILVKKPKSKVPLRGHGRWEDNIKTEVKEIASLETELSCLIVGSRGRFL